MPAIPVYFITNRNKVDTADVFGGERVTDDPKLLAFGKAYAENVDPANDMSPRFGGVESWQYEGFAARIENEITTSRQNLLVFLHSGSTEFAAAIARAGHLQSWFAASGANDADTLAIALSWPSPGTVVALPPRWPQDAYFTDQDHAERSAFHMALALREIADILARSRATHPGRKAFLLAHSMGNHALARGVQRLADDQTLPPLAFNEAFLVAADEPDDTFDQPANGGLSALPRLARRISVYYSRADPLMVLSWIANRRIPLGRRGPRAGSRAAAAFHLRDCTRILDYNPVYPADALHEYFRKSATVRGDIAARMASA